jgi:hypothetical protein
VSGSFAVVRKSVEVVAAKRGGSLLRREPEGVASPEGGRESVDREGAPASGELDSSRRALVGAPTGEFGS